MTRSISAENMAALQANQLQARDFLYIVAKDRVTAAPIAVGFWSDVGDISTQVVNPDTGAPVTRDFYGSGTLIEISAIPLVANLSVQQVEIKMSQLDDLVEQSVREYDCKQARVEVHRGLFSPGTGDLVSPAVCRFVGFIDEIKILTPAEDADGGVTITCTSHTQELLRHNPDTRSHESQILRNPSDTFFKDASVVGEWEIEWGQTKEAVSTAPAKKKGLLGWGNFLGFL